MKDPHKHKADGGRIIEIIALNTSNVLHCIQTFDFECCKIIHDGNVFHANDKLLTSIASRRLNLSKDKYQAIAWIQQAGRIEKYTAKGFTITVPKNVTVTIPHYEMITTYEEVILSLISHGYTCDTRRIPKHANEWEIIITASLN